jgi:hypothetical protein
LYNFDVPTAAKVPEIQNVLEALAARFGVGCFSVVDHWPTDPLAVGVARADDKAVLAYVSVESTFTGEAVKYYVALELKPSGPHETFQAAGDFHRLTLAEIPPIVGRHLGLEPGPRH